MAIFQYELEVLPYGFFELHRFNLVKGLDENFAWEGFEQPSSQFLDKIRELLPFNHSWSGGDVEEYQPKEDWSSKIQIFTTDGELESITLKFSPINDNLDLLISFISFVCNEGYLLYSRSSQSLVDLNIESVIEDLKQSNAFKFTENPEQILIKAAKELKQKDK